MNNEWTRDPNKQSTPTSEPTDTNDTNRLIDAAAALQQFAVVYLRPGQPELPPEAMRDLEQYLELLRAYYGIPADQPVFPPRKQRAHSEKAARTGSQPSDGAKNPAEHPWRAA